MLNIDELIDKVEELPNWELNNNTLSTFTEPELVTIIDALILYKEMN